MQGRWNHSKHTRDIVLREKGISIGHGHGHGLIELVILRLEASKTDGQHTWEVKIEGARHISATVNVAVKS